MPAAAATPSKSADARGTAGRITHDARGNAIWNWAVSIGQQALESTSRLLKRLEVPELSVEEKPKELEIEESKPGGGYDPYNQRTNGRRTR